MVTDPGRPASARPDRSAVQVRVTPTVPPARKSLSSTVMLIDVHDTPASDSDADAAWCARLSACAAVVDSDAARAAADAACSTSCLP